MGRVIIAPLLGQGVEDAPSKNGPLPLKARPGWFVQQPIISGLNQPPRLRLLRRLRGILLMGAATPPWPRRGVSRAPKSRQKTKILCLFVATIPLFLPAA